MEKFEINKKLLSKQYQEVMLGRLALQSKELFDSLLITKILKIRSSHQKAFLIIIIEKLNIIGILKRIFIK